MKPPIPVNEQARVELLRQYDVLDTGPEAIFDEITAQAAQICRTPVSLLAFVDRDRQWVKSAVGQDARQTPRDDAFCAHAICECGLFVVADTLADERFSDHPLVTHNPFLRFYAAVPLVSPEGLAVGALCVLDHKPRELTPEQGSQLEALAKSAMLLLEIRRTKGHTPLHS